MSQSLELEELDLNVELAEDVQEAPPGGPDPCNRDAVANFIEPGLIAINAHKLWELGITGCGRIVMSIDRGANIKDRKSVV